MKKIIIFILTFVAVFCMSACNSEEPKLDEYKAFGMDYYIPKGWNMIFENNYDTMVQQMYSPQKSSTEWLDCIAVYHFVDIGNVLPTKEDAENYADEAILNYNPGFEVVLTEKIYMDIPARYGRFIQEFQGKTREVECYLFIPSESSVFMISYFHDVDSKDDYSDIFAECVNSLEFNNYAYRNT